MKIPAGVSRFTWGGNETWQNKPTGPELQCTINNATSQRRNCLLLFSAYHPEVKIGRIVSFSIIVLSLFAGIKFLFKRVIPESPGRLAQRNYGLFVLPFVFMHEFRIMHTLNPISISTGKLYGLLFRSKLTRDNLTHFWIRQSNRVTR